MKTKPRAVLYLRLSQSDDASTSIDRQEKDLRALAEREGWDVVAVLTDDGISGRKARANADKALAMIADGDADVLAVWKMDRWSRQGISALGDLLKTLEKKPAAIFVALQDGLRSSQGAWRVIASVLAEVAKMEADNTSLRVKSSQHTLKHSGRFPGGAVPFGYASAPAPDGPGRVLVIAPAEAKVVRETAASILSGVSLAKITADLNNAGVPTARSAYRLALAAGKPADGLDRGVWRISTLRVLFVSDHLLGRVTHRGQLVTDEHGLPARVWEPILDLQTVSRLRARLGDPRAKAERPRKVRAARLLSGVAYCAECGAKLYVRTSGGKDIYGCSASANGGTCPCPRIMAEALEDYVAAQFLAVVGAAPEVEEVEHVSDPGVAESLAEIEAALQEATTALLSDDADPAALMARIASLKARRAELKAIPATVERSLVPTGRTLAEAWEADLDVDARRALLLSALDHVAVKMRERRGPQFEPERVVIAWQS